MVDGSTLSVSVSDGAGSAKRGGTGAALLCRTLDRLIGDHFSRTSELPDDAAIESWIDIARDRISDVAKRSALTARDFACTLILTISNGSDTVVAHIGDGAAAVRLTDNSWEVMSWPAQGEYASTTFFVTDEVLKLRTSRLSFPINGLACFTDGIERLALNFGRGVAHDPFFQGIIRPVDALDSPGRDARLSKALQIYLDAPAVNERTDDDKTLVLAALR